MRWHGGGLSNNIAAYSYAIAALACLALLGWLWIRRTRLPGPTLIVATLCAAAWGTYMALDQRNALSASGNSLADLLRNAAWTAVLLDMLGQLGRRVRTRSPLLRVALVGYGAALALWLKVAFWPGAYDFTLQVLINMALALLGMALVEQLYRATQLQKRWAVKFACIGLGGLFVYDFYLYSDALLFHQMNSELWAGRGLVTALTTPLLAMSVQRHAIAVTQLTVSRRMLFHSAAFAGAAVYVLTMSMAAYYLRYAGGNWGSLMQLAFLFGATLLLAGILVSGASRAWLKVFLSKHFYRYNYDYREEWQRFTNTLSEPGPLLAERSIEALARLVESPGGALWMRSDNGSYMPRAQWQMAAQHTAEPAESPFCRFVEQHQWLVDLTNTATADRRVPVPDWIRQLPRAAWVVPLMLHGQLSGFVLLLRSSRPVALNWEVIDLLKIAGSQAASYLAQQEAGNALIIARQFDSFSRLSTFVVHDLKNLVAQLTLLTTNAEKHRDNPEFQADMARTMAYSVQKMRGMLQKLSPGASGGRPEALSLDRLLSQVVAQKSMFTPRPQLLLVDRGQQVVADAERLERVLGHLLQNAIEATPRDGSVTVTLRASEGEACLDISDTGSGMSEDFVRERLFKPFDSTKSAGMGIGAFESQEYIGQLGGRLLVRSALGAGTTFTVCLRCHNRTVPHEQIQAVTN